jgi:hypothetical protein
LENDMTDRERKLPPNQEFETAPDFNEQPKPQGEAPEDGMRQMPTDPPAVVPSAASESFGIAAGMGLAGFAKQNPEGGFVGDEDAAWERDPTAENETADEGDTR